MDDVGAAAPTVSAREASAAPEPLSTPRLIRTFGDAAMGSSLLAWRRVGAVVVRSPAHMSMRVACHGTRFAKCAVEQGCWWRAHPNWEGTRSKLAGGRAELGGGRAKLTGGQSKLRGARSKLGGAAGK